jgi:hypothetical protein
MPLNSEPGVRTATSITGGFRFEVNVQFYKSFAKDDRIVSTKLELCPIDLVAAVVLDPAVTTSV